MTLITNLPLWVRLVSGQEVGGSGGNDSSEGNLPASHELASRALCKAALLACSGCGLAWLWLFPECAISLLPASTEGLLAAESGSGQPCFILSLPVSLQASVAISAIGLGWAPPLLHPVWLLSLCTSLPNPSPSPPAQPMKGLTD